MKLALAAAAATALISASAASFANDEGEHYKDLWQLKQLHSAFHESVSHAGVDAATKMQHLTDQLALWADDAAAVALVWAPCSADKALLIFADAALTADTRSVAVSGVTWSLRKKPASASKRIVRKPMLVSTASTTAPPARSAACSV